MLSSFSFSDNRIGFIIDGPYDEEAMEKIQFEITEKLKKFDKLNLYIEDTPNAEISLKSMIVKLPFKIKIGRHFTKVAIVSDRKGVHLIRAFERVFFSGEFRQFSSSRRLEAIKWISE